MIYTSHTIILIILISVTGAILTTILEYRVDNVEEIIQEGGLIVPELPDPWCEI